MKVLVFLLVLANLLFYAFGAGYFGRFEGADSARLTQQVQPERLRIVSRGEAPKGKSTEVAVAEPVQVDPTRFCAVWERLSENEGERLAALLTEKFSTFSFQRMPGEGAQWWVFIPAQRNKSEAERKVAQLRSLGVGDYFVVSEGANRNAVSLGIFSSEKAAEERLAELKGRGVRSARMTQRSSRDVSLNLQVTGPLAQRDALLAATKSLLDRGEPQVCP